MVEQKAGLQLQLMPKTSRYSVLLRWVKVSWPKQIYMLMNEDHNLKMALYEISQNIEGKDTCVIYFNMCSRFQ